MRRPGRSEKWGWMLERHSSQAWDIHPYHSMVPSDDGDCRLARSGRRDHRRDSEAEGTNSLNQCDGPEDRPVLPSYYSLIIVHFGLSEDSIQDARQSLSGTSHDCTQQVNAGSNLRRATGSGSLSHLVASSTAWIMSLTRSSPSSTPQLTRIKSS